MSRLIRIYTVRTRICFFFFFFFFFFFCFVVVVVVVVFSRAERVNKSLKFGHDYNHILLGILGIGCDCGLTHLLPWSSGMRSHCIGASDTVLSLYQILQNN